MRGRMEGRMEKEIWMEDKRECARERECVYERETGKEKREERWNGGNWEEG